MLIKYETKGSILVTKCPYYKDDAYPIATPQVGSTACRKCKHFQGIDYDSEIVDCNKE